MEEKKEERSQPAAGETVLDPDKVPHRGAVFNFFWPFTRWIVTSVSAGVAKIFFLIPNRSIVIGRNDVGEGPNTVLRPNH